MDKTSYIEFLNKQYEFARTEDEALNVIKELYNACRVISVVEGTGMRIPYCRMSSVVDILKYKAKMFYKFKGTALYMDRLFLLLTDAMVLISSQSRELVTPDDFKKFEQSLNERLEMDTVLKGILEPFVVKCYDSDLTDCTQEVIDDILGSPFFDNVVSKEALKEKLITLNPDDLKKFSIFQFVSVEKILGIDFRNELFKIKPSEDNYKALRALKDAMNNCRCEFSNLNTATVNVKTYLMETSYLAKGLETLNRELKKAVKDPNVKYILIEGNSTGGSFIDPDPEKDLFISRVKEMLVKANQSKPVLPSTKEDYLNCALYLRDILEKMNLEDKLSVLNVFFAINSKDYQRLGDASKVLKILSDTSRENLHYRYNAYLMLKFCFKGL